MLSDPKQVTTLVKMLTPNLLIRLDPKTPCDPIRATRMFFPLEIRIWKWICLRFSLFLRIIKSSHPRTSEEHTVMVFSFFTTVANDAKIGTHPICAPPYTGLFSSSFFYSSFINAYIYIIYILLILGYISIYIALYIPVLKINNNNIYIFFIT